MFRRLFAQSLKFGRAFSTPVLRKFTQSTRTFTPAKFVLTSLAATALCPFETDGSSPDYVSQVRKNEAAIRSAISDLLDGGDYDGHGSYAPLFVRLAWHASGTYCKNTKTGGSQGACMRFAPELTHGANAGLDIAQARLESVKKQFPFLTYADLWTLAAVVAIEEMGGPSVRWRPGRSDYRQGQHYVVPTVRLPDASKDGDHVEEVFSRMGFTNRDITALLGAHAIGKCHSNRSGYEGPWTRSPTTFSNSFYTTLMQKQWVKKNWDGPEQYENTDGGDLMMLPSDLVIMNDKRFAPFASIYAEDEQVFFHDFAEAFGKMLELGVSFK